MKESIPVRSPLSLPFARSYWVDPGHLMAGAYPGSSRPEEAPSKLIGLLDAGITSVISLMEQQERNHSGQPFVDYSEGITHMAHARGLRVVCFRHSVVDGSVPSLEVMKGILDGIDEALNAGGRTYVHCWGGRGRTGTAVCCWMIRHGIVAPNQAADHLQTLIRHNAQAFYPTPEFETQRYFVRNWIKRQ